MASIVHHINRKLDHFTACWKGLRSWLTVVELGSSNSIFVVALFQHFVESKTVMKILLDCTTKMHDVTVQILWWEVKNRSSDIFTLKYLPVIRERLIMPYKLCLISEIQRWKSSWFQFLVRTIHFQVQTEVWMMCLKNCNLLSYWLILFFNFSHSRGQTAELNLYYALLRSKTKRSKTP